MLRRHLPTAVGRQGAAQCRPKSLPLQEKVFTGTREVVILASPFKGVRAPGKQSGGLFPARTGPAVRDGTQCVSIGRARLAGPGTVPRRGG